MFKLKPISADGIPGALAKAERYRLLNEPDAAESICLDILEIEPQNQKALVMLVLSRADQIARNVGATNRAQEVLPHLSSEYEQAYYAGLVAERRGHAQLHAKSMGASHLAWDWFHEAMECYERAQQIHPAGNDDAILRWNSCARVLNAHPELKPRPEEPRTHVLGE
jgi:hypothetical protein